MRSQNNLKAKSLYNLLYSEDLSFLMEAHDALSARIVEEVGFRGIWASGLSISTSLGYRDANEASWTEVANAVERIAHLTSIPILVDGDSGFGNFNNARLVAKKFWERGAAGICIEDKFFPKMNSFLGNNHPLINTDEFCGRLKAIKDYIPNNDFVLVARTEALIAELGQEEALTRAHAYADAGADAILIHSRKATAEEVFNFSKQWNNRLPLVIVPTKYYKTPTSSYRDNKISTIIWANHNMRAASQAMQAVCKKIFDEESIINIEEQIDKLETIFKLLNYSELEKAEAKYLL